MVHVYKWRNYMLAEFPERYPELEPYFQRLTDITDNISIMNTPYEVDQDKDFSDLVIFFNDLTSRDWEKSDPAYYELFTSFFTFHIKVVEEIIREARQILNPEKRPYLKKLVTHKKDAEEWFFVLRKKRKATAMSQTFSNLQAVN